MRVQYSLPVTAPIVAMDQWRNILTRLLKLDFNVPRKLQGPISSVKGLKNRRFYSTPLPGQIFSSSWYVILQLVPKPSGIIVCYTLRVHRPSTMQFLNKLRTSSIKDFTFQMLSRRTSGNNANTYFKLCGRRGTFQSLVCLEKR